MIKQLNFLAQKPPAPFLPPIYCQVDGHKVQISGFDSSQPPVPSPVNLAQSMKQLYFELSLPELARIRSLLTEMTLTSYIDSVLQAFGVRTDFTLGLDFLASLPLEIQYYFSEKKLSPNELRALTPSPENFRNSQMVIAKGLKLRLSKMEILETSEWANELIEMGILLPSAETKEKWLSQLKALRYPRATQVDSTRGLRAKHLPSPSNCHCHWVRRGDTAGLELKLFATTASDFKSKIEKCLQLDVESVWKNPS